ncbi:MAG: hypothetical protein M3410_06750 [Acidobacteriota bacterium]|nr:hypothetical protein [Acidobacteriota bacterium]
MKFSVVLTLLTLFSSVAAFQSASKERIYLELGDTIITENGESVIEVGGKCGSGQVLAFHLPKKGWFVASVEPFAGHDFQKIGKLDGNRITFKVDDRRYEIISDQPISRQTSSLELWVVRVTPPADKADAESKLISCATDFKYWLEKTLLRNEKE